MEAEQKKIYFKRGKNSRYLSFELGNGVTLRWKLSSITAAEGEDFATADVIEQYELK